MTREILTSRERIIYTLKRLPVDRIPADIWYTPEIMNDLKYYFQVSSDSEVFTRLGVDKILMLEAPWKSQSLQKNHTIWGNIVQSVTNETGGTYEEIVTYPLAGKETLKDIQEYSWPDVDAYDFHALTTVCNEHPYEIRMLSFISLFENYCKLKPMDQAMIDLYIFPDLAEYIIGKLLQLQKDYIIQAFRECGNLIDIVYLSDDMGMQDRALLGFDTWETFFKKPYHELIDLIHELGAYTFYHSDGAAFDVLKAMTSLGTDIINPLQYVCPGMERERLKKELGEYVIFHGAVENQQIIPFGTPEAVRKEVFENIEILGANGGYICAPCHNIQPGTPIENIIALYDAIREYSSAT